MSVTHGFNRVETVFTVSEFYSPSSLRGSTHKDLLIISKNA